MHVFGIPLDPNWFLQFIFTAFIIAFGLLHVVKNTASKYFEVDANFEGGGGSSDRKRRAMPGIPVDSMDTSCVVCGNPGTKKCSRCKSARYCSIDCQQNDWKAGHKTKCKDSNKVNSTQTVKADIGAKASGVEFKRFSAVALLPSSKVIKKPRKILFPYDEFVKLFNWDKPGFPPCGLLNCGNSCFANVVLQCLTYTRPLVAYLLEKGHQRECRRNDWCFLCAFQSHAEIASQSSHPFSPLNILSRLTNIGGNLGYGRQEDAHEFMRFAIDTMQSTCLDEFGGEKAVDPSSQETTLIQHIFGGHLQSQVICTKCNKISNQYENMMDLTVEIHGDAASLEECLDQFTVKEWLHGDNMYKCDGCNDYVKAWKRLTVRRAPNILTIALKRFQSGRFGKLNKRVTFPETLDLTPYMSEEGDGMDVYKLYAVVVHVDMLNASFFGHYICYIKDFCGNWYRVDDCKVITVQLDEVLSQGAYMLLYSRVRARSSCLRSTEPSPEEQQNVNGVVEPCSKEKVECLSANESIDSINCSETLPSDHNPQSDVCISEKDSSSGINSDAVNEDSKNVGVVNFHSSLPVSKDVSTSHSFRVDVEDMYMVNSKSSPSFSKEVSDFEKDSTVAFYPEGLKEDRADINILHPESEEASACENDSSVAIDSEAVMEVSGGMNMVDFPSTSSFYKDIEVNGSIGDAEANGCLYSFPSETSSGKPLNSKGELRFRRLHDQNGHGAKRAETTEATRNS